MRCFLSFIIILVTATGLSLSAQPASLSEEGISPDIDVTKLAFTPLRQNECFSVAEDHLGRTWVRGVIPRDLIGKAVVFRIPSARIHDYRLYLFQEDKLTPVPRDTGGKDGHLKSRFPQCSLIASSSCYYVEIGNHTPSTLRIEIQEHGQFSARESIALFRIGLYYGLAVMSVVFNVIFYLIFKDKRFITYCVLLFTTFLSFFYEDGMFYYFSGGAWTMDYLTVWNSSATGIVSLMFTYYFLSLETVLRSYRKAYLFASGALLLGALVYTLTDIVIVYHTVAAVCFILLIINKR